MWGICDFTAMSLLKGCLARVRNLQQRPELNGTAGLIVDSGERMTLLTIPQRHLLAVRPACLELHIDHTISVCAQCFEDWWSWDTHGGYAGWSKLRRGKYACPRCTEGPTFAQPTGSWAHATSGGAQATAGGASAQAFAQASGSWAHAASGGAPATAGGASAQAFAQV